MEKFDIQLADGNYTIEPQENGTFRVMDGEQKLCVVYPEPGTLAVEWKSMDDVNIDFVEQIGELISAHQIGRTV